MPSGRFSITAWEKRPNPDSPRSSNHLSTGVNGISPTPPPASSSSNCVEPLSPRTATSDSLDTDLHSNTSRGENTTPAAFARATNWIDMMLSPPSAKNESSTPTTSTPSTSPNSPVSTFSISVSGARYSARPAAKSGAGNAARSSFPFGVTGTASTTTTAAGTMCGANRSPANARTSRTSRSTPTPGTTYPTNRSPAPSSPRTTTTARATPTHADRHRLDLTQLHPETPHLHLQITRDPHTRRNPHRNRATAPHPPSDTSADPQPTNGSATNRAAVNPARSRYPRARAAPATYNSPTTPTGTGRNQPSSTHLRRHPESDHRSSPATPPPSCTHSHSTGSSPPSDRTY